MPNIEAEANLKGIGFTVGRFLSTEKKSKFPKKKCTCFLGFDFQKLYCAFITI
jgi:hypothetical protein